jgi:hypothetical protein
MSDEDAMDVDPPVLSRPSSSNVYLYGACIFDQCFLLLLLAVFSRQKLRE